MSNDRQASHSSGAPLHDDAEKGPELGISQPSSDDDQVQKEEGTYHQAQFDFKVKRKHFFSPLDASYAEAVHRDAERVQFTPEEEVI